MVTAAVSLAQISAFAVLIVAVGSGYTVTSTDAE
jgi:hypothetical protein